MFYYMEIQIKNKVERTRAGNFKFLESLKRDVLEYTRTFEIGDKKIYDYTRVSFVFEAYPILTRFYPILVKQLQDFIMKVCDHIISEFEKLDKTHVDAINNFQSHRLKVVSTGGFVLKLKKYLDWCEKEIKNFIGSNLRHDGSSLDFGLRDSLTYVTYTLEPLVETCVNLWRSNRNIYYFYVHPSTKSSIMKSVRWLIPFIKGEKINVMFINSVYASDKNKKEYGLVWEKSNALNLINLSINFDRTLIGLYDEND